MTQEPVPAAASSILLPSGRVVAAGDLLSLTEAQHLVILQRGKTPLRPMAVSPDTYQLALHDRIPTALVLGELFTTAQPLIVDLKAAEGAYILYMASEDAAPVPVPIGEGRFVLQAFEHLAGDSMTAFLDWQMDQITRQMVVAEMDIQASGVPSAQA